MSLFEPPPLPGDQVASYHLLETLGIGGNATVYKATCPIHGFVAIKVLHPGKTTEEDIKRFHREYVSLQKLKNPNIVQVYESGTHGEYPWISMEFIEGSDLSELIEEWKAYSEADFSQIKDILAKICSAIEYIHQQGMIHRDLKPSNVLITKDNQPKITDFGGVKAPSTFHSELTTMGKLVGTVAFMAPEHILGETLDKRADLYSLGALLYMCLTGKKPFEAQNIAGYLSLHLTTPPPNPQTSNPSVPKELNDICIRLMQKDRGDRFQSAQAVIDVLSHKTVVRHPILALEEEQKTINHNIKTFLNGQNILLCLYGYRGTGKNNLIKNIIHTLKENKIHISLNSSEISPKKHQAFIIDSLSPTTDFLEKLRQSINEGKHILMLITSPTKTIFYEEALGIPCEKIYIRPLNVPEIQRLLSQYKIKGKSNLILAQRLHSFFKGRQEYISEAVSIMPFKKSKGIKISEAKNIKIEIPNIVRKNNHYILSKLSPNAKQILECILVYKSPLSQQAILQLCEQSPTDFKDAIHLLHTQHWITYQNDSADPLISLEKHHLDEVLYQLIKPERRILWHKRIAAILRKNRRLQSNQLLLLAHHFEKAERYKEAFVTLLKVAPKLHSSQSWPHLREIISTAEQLYTVHSFDVSTDELFTLFQWCETVYTHLDNHNVALDYNRRSLDLNISPMQRAELEIRSSLLQYNTTFSQRSLPILGQEHPLWLRGMTDSALHEFLEGRLEQANQYWSTLSTHSNPIAKNVGFAGQHLLTAIEGPREPFLTYIQQQHQNLPDYWLIWLIENYICIGRWQDALILAQDVSERLQNDPIFCTRALALEGLLHIFMGKLSHAYQALSTIKSILLAPFDVSSTRSAIHIARLSLALGKELPTYSFNWNELSVHIDDLRNQWLILLSRHRQQPPQTLPSIAIPWTQDLLLYDVAHSIRVNPSLDYLEEIWQNVSENSIAIRMIIAKHFLFISSKSIWKKRFNSSLQQCKEQTTDSFYDFDNWRH